MDLTAFQTLDSHPSLYGFDFDELKKLVAQAGFPTFRADQLAGWLYQKHIQTFEEAKNLPTDFRAYLNKNYSAVTLRLSETAESSDRESTKFLFKTWDERLLESVLIAQRDRRTLCVSTQLGCKIGCIFCASGKGKFARNLSAGEIVEQAAQVERMAKQKLTNVVFMGMGEPLDNFEATMKALKILQAPWGFGLGARRITVSTSGITPKILEFVTRSEGRVRLSVSLHASSDAVRSELVPINKKYSLKELKETLTQVNRELKRDITFEYTLIKGKNDSKEEAEGVAKLARPLNAKVNIIPYNPIREMEFETPSGDAVQNFSDILKRRGVRVTIRQTAGRDIHAACGQLRLDREERR